MKSSRLICFPPTGCARETDARLGRENLIWAVHELRPVYDSYQRLKHRSELARYEAVTFSAEQVRALQATELAHIKSHIATLL